MIDFSENTNKASSTLQLENVLKKNVHLVKSYPDYNNGEIRGLIKKYFGISSEHIALGVGSTQLLFDIPKLLTYKRAVVIVPTFWEYTAFNTLFNKKIIKVQLSSSEDFAPDFALIRKTIKSGDCVFIANVNSPTSVLYKKSELLALINDYPEVQFVIDETFLIFRKDFVKQSLLKEAPERKNLIVVMSFSKFFTLSGARVGFFTSHVSLVEKYNKFFQIPYSLGPLTQVALAFQLKDAAKIAKVRDFYQTEREAQYLRIKDKLKGRLYPIRPDGNFIMCRVQTGQTGWDIKIALQKKGILIRSGHELNDISGEWVRFCILSKKENILLLKHLDQVLN